MLWLQKKTSPVMVALWHWVAHPAARALRVREEFPFNLILACRHRHLKNTDVFFSGRSHVPPYSSTYGWKFARGIHHPHTDLGEKSQQKWQFRILQGPFLLIFPLEPPLSAGMFHVGHYRMSLIPRSRKSSHLPSSHLVNLDTQLVNQDVLD